MYYLMILIQDYYPVSKILEVNNRLNKQISDSQMTLNYSIDTE